MSILTKIFIVLVLIAATVMFGYVATLYSLRQDFRTKWQNEVNLRYQQKKRFSEQLAEKENTIKNLKEVYEHEKGEKERLQERVEGLKNEIKEMRRSFDDLQHEKIELDKRNESLQNRLSSALEELKGVTEWVEKYNKAVQEMRRFKEEAQKKEIYTKAEMDELKKVLAELEEAYTKTLRAKIEAENALAELKKRGIEVGAVGPVTPIEGQVMEVSQQYRFVVLNVGSDDGVKSGEEFTVYREDKYIATVVVDKVENRYCSARIRYNAADIKRGDRVSNTIGR